MRAVVNCTDRDRARGEISVATNFFRVAAIAYCNYCEAARRIGGRIYGEAWGISTVYSIPHTYATLNSHLTTYEKSTVAQISDVDV